MALFWSRRVRMIPRSIHHLFFRSCFWQRIIKYSTRIISHPWVCEICLWGLSHVAWVWSATWVSKRNSIPTISLVCAFALPTRFAYVWMMRETLNRFTRNFTWKKCERMKQMRPSSVWCEVVDRTLRKTRNLWVVSCVLNYTVSPRDAPIPCKIELPWLRPR